VQRLCVTAAALSLNAILQRHFNIAWSLAQCKRFVCTGIKLYLFHNLRTLSLLLLSPPLLLLLLLQV
jgi:hypothetical protein